MNDKRKSMVEERDNIMLSREILTQQLFTYVREHGNQIRRYPNLPDIGQ